MEQENQNNNTTNPNEKKESRKPKADSKANKQSFSDVVADHKAEFKKIVWPKRPEVIKKTATVIVTSIFIGAVIFCMDTVFAQLQPLLVNILN